MLELPPVARRMTLIALVAGCFVGGLGAGIVVTGGVSAAIYGNRGTLSVSGTNSGNALSVAQGGDATAIRGISEYGVAGRFGSTNGVAVLAVTGNPDGEAISGQLDATASGSGAAVRGTARAGIGVAGSTQVADAAGVLGTSTGGGAGVAGTTAGGAGAGVVAVGTGPGSTGLVARSITRDGFGLVAIGPSGTASYIAGDETITGNQIAGGFNVGTTGIIARNIGMTDLPLGTPVRVAGAEASLIGGTPTLLVAAATPGDLVIGIVARAMTIARSSLPGATPQGDVTPGGGVTVLRSAEGPARAGLTLIVATSGVVGGVMVDPGSTPIRAGQALVLGPNGSLVARAADDLVTPTVGLALDPVKAAHTIPVLLVH